jgi:Domain of unknown function (DUF397)
MSKARDLSQASWFKSSYSNGQGGACVEVASNLPGIVAVRDSKDRTGPDLAFTRQAWSEFVQAIQRGDFNL